MKTKHTLTGKKRYRTHTPLYGKTVLVLQVEEHSAGHSDGGSDPYDMGRDWENTSFRDATVEDFGEL